MKKQCKKKNNFIAFSAIILSSLFLLTGCGSTGGGGGGSSESGGNGTTAVSISINTPSAAISSSDGVSAQSAPRVVSFIKIEIKAGDQIIVEDQFGVTPGSTVTKTYNIATGSSIVVKIFACDAGGCSEDNILYTGTSLTTLLGTEPVSIDIKMILYDLGKAFEKLAERDVVGAQDLFRAAVAKYKDSDSDEKDMAYFFNALTRIMVFWFDMQLNTPVDSDFDNAIDIFGYLGCSTVDMDPWDLDIDFSTPDDPVDPLFTGMECPGITQVNYQGEDFSDFIEKVMLELDGAISDLDKVSGSFNVIWTEPFDGSQVESDIGDVFFLRAVLKAARIAYMNSAAYSSDVDIESGTDLDLYTIGDFFEENPNFPDKQGDLSDSVIMQGEALDDIELALDAIESEINSGDIDQSDDWINMGEDAPESLKNILEARNDIAKARDCYNNGAYGNCTVDDNDTTDTSDDTIVDFGRYFNNSVNVNLLIPEFSLDDPIGMLPDPTFGGMLVMLNGNYPVELNNDEDGEGTADIFQQNIYYVYGADALFIDPLDYCDDPESFGFELLDAVVFDPNNPEAIIEGAYTTFVVKYSTGDYGVFNEFYEPDMRIDTFGFLGDDLINVGYVLDVKPNFGYNEWYDTLRYIEDGRGPEIDSRSDCIVIGSAPSDTSYLKVYSMP